MGTRTGRQDESGPAAQRGTALLQRPRKVWLVLAVVGAAVLLCLTVRLSLGRHHSDQSLPAGPQVTTEHESLVYSIVLTQPYDKGIESLGISSRTMRVDETRRGDRFLRRHLKGISTRTIDDFYAKNAACATVSPSIRANLPVVIETQSFQQLQQKYASPPGLITFSRVGFHENQALLCLHRIWGVGLAVAGGDTFVLLERDGDAWRVRDTVRASVY
jgi:hypothetical protein